MSVAVITETKQYLTFKMNEEIFAVDVSRVREILELSPITKIPKSSEFMRGVINVRGSIIPIVDLKLSFSMGKTEEKEDTCIVVMEIFQDRDDIIVVGILADSVQEVIKMDAEIIEAVPKIGIKVDADFIQGMGKIDDQFVIILDIDKIFSLNELLNVKKAMDKEISKA